MISSLVSSLTVLVFGTLYPAYCSYKAVKSKNVREYVKWMMYWIVFALFTSAETFADIFISWVPFYYEVKVVFVIWLLSPYTQGSSVLYRKFIHPALARRESEIDDMISKAKEQGYSAVLTVGSKAMTSATNLALQAITKGPEMLDQFRRSYSSSDVNQVQITELNDDGSPLHYDNDLALVHQQRRANAIDSEEEVRRRQREESDQRIEYEFARRMSRDLSLSRERTSSTSSSSSSSFSNNNPRKSGGARPPSSSYSPSTSPALSNRLSAAHNEAPPLKQEEVLQRFSKLSPDTQRRVLGSKDSSVYAAMVARHDLDDDDDDDDDYDDEDDVRDTNGDEEMDEDVEETYCYDGEGRKVKSTSKPPRPPPPKFGLSRSSSREEEDEEERRKRKTSTSSSSSSSTTRPRAPPPPLPADATATGKKLRMTAVPKGVHRRVKAKEEKK